MMNIKKLIFINSLDKLVKNIYIRFPPPMYITKRYCTPSQLQQSYLTDEEKNVIAKNFSVNKYTNRSHTCGELSRNHLGKTVTLCGWLGYQRMNKFVILRDNYGETQLLLKDTDEELHKLVKSIPYESIIEIQGTVLSRPKDMINKKQLTGEIEVLVDQLKILNKATDKLPFNIREFQKAKEPLRMQYRYLDLRFPQMQKNLRVRSSVLMKMREFLINNNFVDIETPTLFKATPGGAQEFIVPTRFPGQFYALVQSPQQFKQMLMAGAIDRYFQIARCYRDETTRPDRQPEFTQLDIEMSFTNQNGIIHLVQEVISYAWPEFLENIPPVFPRITYKDAMENYGSDKPDIRFGFKIQTCTELVQTNPNLVTEKDFGAYFIVFPEEYAILNKELKGNMSLLAFKYKRAKLIQSKIKSVKDWISKISKSLSRSVAINLTEQAKLQDRSVLFLVYGNKQEALSLLGTIRLEYVNFLEKLGVNIRQKGMKFLWVVDFPLFEISEETGMIQSTHHPFTAPHPDDFYLLKEDPLKVRSLAYDLVLNGNEIAGGSIRIHDPSLQKSILNILNINPHTMRHFLKMLNSGCPPHGGIALGLDRFFAILLNMASIRDVIAFPKNFEGRDPVSGAPSEISEKEEKLYHIKSVDCDEKQTCT